MPRYLCDYCDAYLTHDSVTGRKQHCTGWKHRENFKQYYMQFYPQWAAENPGRVMQNQQQFGQLPPPMFAMPIGQPPMPMMPGQTPIQQLAPGQAPPQFRPPPQFQPPPAMPPMSR